MKYKSFILLTTAMYFAIVECDLAPDINLEGSLLTNNDTKVLQLVCSTNIAVQLCTVEFLIDEKTHDNIRYYDNNCYHTMWICSPNVCKCSDDCMSFTLNVTVTEHMMNHSFSCATRIKTDSVTYLTNISVKHDGNKGFTLFQKIIVPYRSVSSTQRVTTYSPELTTSSSVSAPLIIAVAAVAFLSFVILVIILFMTCRRYWNSKTETRAKLSNTISNTENTSVETFNRIEVESRSDVHQFNSRQRYSPADSGISCISFTRPGHITLDADLYPKIPEVIDTGSFGDLYPKIPEVIDTGSFGDSDLRIPEAIDSGSLEADPDIRIHELFGMRSFGADSDLRIPETIDTGSLEDPYSRISEGLGHFGADPDIRIHELFGMRSFGADSDLRIAETIDTGSLEDPYSRISEGIGHFGDSTSYITQSSSRSSPLETESLFDNERNRCVLTPRNNCSILSFQDSDN